MWLSRTFPRASLLALRTYYRFERAGGEVPPEGPVLLVANHPNSLLDPAAVCAVADRPVRFLAKAPLFSDPLVGWIMRACGAIPVYRRQDDPSLMDRNEEAFRAAHRALAGGDAVGIFPEGMSHSEPSLAPLKTGAARIALGAADLLGASFPIVPMGLVLRRKERFRSRALVVVGEPVEWDDLRADGSAGGPGGSAGPDGATGLDEAGGPDEARADASEAGDAPADEEAVRALTRRIEEALRRVTVNLERWEDAPVVECAEAIYAAEHDLPRDRAERVRRLGQVSGALTALRRQDPERLEPVYGAIARYAALLDLAELTSGRLDRDPSPGAALRWTLRQLLFFLVLAPLAAAGAVLFWAPYRVTGLLPARAGVEKDVQATYKVLGGIVIYGVWIGFLAGAVGWLAGPWAGAGAAAALVSLALLTLTVRDRWEEARANARGWLLLRRKGDLRRRLLERRRLLAGRLEELRRELEGASPDAAGRGREAG